MASHGMSTESRQDGAEIVSSIARHMNGFMYRCEPSGDYAMLFVTPNIQRLLGYSPTQVVGAGAISFASLVSPDDVEHVVAVFNRCIEAREPWEVEYRVRHRDGRWIWVQEQGAAIFDEHGALQFMEGAIFSAEGRRAAQMKEETRMTRLSTFSRKVLADTDDILRALKTLTILSFNAKVEAARMGPHGKGFAVIAEQVGELASITSLHAGKIESHLGEIRSLVKP